VKLLLDENISPVVAALLRERGHDAIAASDTPELRTMADDGLWLAAVNQGRTIITYDVHDYVVIAKRWGDAGKSHDGLVLASPRSRPRNLGMAQQLADAIELLEATYSPAGLADLVVWLPVAE